MISLKANRLIGNGSARSFQVTLGGDRAHELRLIEFEIREEPSVIMAGIMLTLQEARALCEVLGSAIQASESEP